MLAYTYYLVVLMQIFLKEKQVMVPIIFAFVVVAPRSSMSNYVLGLSLSSPGNFKWSVTPF